jgi:DUF4097 and DUF4098 domain-containing protein YvlB
MKRALLFSLGLFLAGAPSRPAAAQKDKGGGDGAMASAPAPRGVTVRLETTSGDIEVVRNGEARVVVEVEDDNAGAVRLVPRDRNVLEVQSTRHFGSSGVRLRVPAGSAVDVRTQSGDIHVRDLGGEAFVRSLSGDISVSGAVRADVRTVSGDTSVEGTGSMRVKTVSGDLEVRERAGPPAPATIELESTSGDVRWTGACGAGCRLSAATVSGDVSLALDARSSFRFTMQSHSGGLEDGLGLQVSRASDRRRGADVEATFGKGEGSVDCRTFSGDARLARR